MKIIIIWGQKLENHIRVYSRTHFKVICHNITFLLKHIIKERMRIVFLCIRFEQNMRLRTSYDLFIVKKFFFTWLKFNEEQKLVWHELELIEYSELELEPGAYALELELELELELRAYIQHTVKLFQDMRKQMNQHYPSTLMI